jgi:chromosome partitioning protein
MIIVVANSKGGVGKSTLAVHLASWLFGKGYRVTLADCDTQQSSSEWIREACPGVIPVRLDNPDVILNELPQLQLESDVRALAKATEVLRQAQDIRGGKPNAIVVLSMVGKNYRLTQDMKNAAAALSLPLASTSMVLRQIYADAPGQGAVVWNMGSRATEAALEAEALFRELLPDCTTRRAPEGATRTRVATA